MLSADEQTQFQLASKKIKYDAGRRKFKYCTADRKKNMNACRTYAIVIQMFDQNLFRVASCSEVLHFAFMRI